MADYAFLYDKGSDQPFVERCTVAVSILADTVLGDGAATSAETAWAYKAFANPVSEGRIAARIVLAANAASTQAQINAASDATIQTNVNAAKGVLVAGNA